MIIVGHDPKASAPALAVYSTTNKIWTLRKFPPRKWPGEGVCPGTLRQIRCFLEGNAFGVPEDSLHFVSEDQFLGANPRSFKTLAVARGQVEGVAVTCGFQIYKPLNPSTWRAAILGCGRPKQDQIKPMAMKQASLITGRPIRDHDIAEAVCMAAYLLHRIESPGGMKA